ncbi:MAG: AbrB/MazE/SpoVT family DNA-binding domain-containing protein [Candidatus Bathyarchaeia archaeon]|jgi:AbrB family looped-hinge helix DNA binding protein
MAIDLTKLSQKGQIVIPNAMRKQLGLKEGTKFLVVNVGDMIVLRKLELNQERARLKTLLKENRRKAEKVGFTEREIRMFIHQSRKAA